MQCLKNSNRLFLLTGVVLCLVSLSSICDALIKVSYVVPDNGPFNNQRLYTSHFKAFSYEKVLRRITIYGSGFTRYMDINFVHGGVSKPVAEFRYLSQNEVQVIPPDWEMPKGKNPVTVDIEISSQAAAGDRDVLKKGFTYNPPPEVESIDPNIGPQDPSLLPGGKETINIKGGGFIEQDPMRPGKTIQVFIGTKRFTLPAIRYKNSQNISLEFSEPLYNKDTVDIVVVNPDGQISAVGERRFMVIGQPAIRTIRPDRGPIEGGNAVHIEGAGLEGGHFSVRVNGQDITASAPMDGSIVCTMPAGVEKNVDVQVIKRTVNQRGRSFDQISNPLKYTYLKMNVYRVEPDIGERGTQVTITGEDFFVPNNLGEESVTVEVFFGGEMRDGEIIGGAEGVNLNVIDSTKLEVEVPEGAGLAPVFVQQSWQAGGESTEPFIRQIMSAENKFTYATGVVIKDFNPRKGSVFGGTLVTITGANFYPDPNKITVTFGDVRATVSDAGREKLHVFAPEHSAGIVDITVKNPDGSSYSFEGFEYIQGPVIEKVEPNFGPVEGGNPITIVGRGLLETSVVLIGGESAGLGAREDSKVVVNAVPPKIAGFGPVDVAASVEGQPDAVLPDGYIYREIEARALIPDNGPLRGGDTVTISGRDFEGWDYDRQKPIAPTVAFGGVQSRVISYTQDSIEVVAPEGTETVPVKIIVRYLYTPPGETTPQEVKQTDTALIYRYNPLPVIASFRPLSGNQGDTLFIEGSGFLTGAEVKMGTDIVQPISVTATEMRIIVPEQTDECEIDIVVVNPDGQEASA
ncbi:MAG: IPT/TIG domain-containing protein, partial [Candidatus Poribacteria bacterium]